MILRAFSFDEYALDTWVNRLDCLIDMGNSHFNFSG